MFGSRDSRLVVCVLLPRFELNVAAGGARELLRRPVALAPTPGRRPVVGQVSAAAEAFSVRPGLSVAEAFARCPELKLVAPDPAAARVAWEGVVRALEGIGAEVECAPDAPGTAYFEADGLRRLLGGLDGVIAAARAAVGRPVRVGVARSRFVAQAAARGARPRRACTVLTDLERREFLAAAPVEWLTAYDGPRAMGAFGAAADGMAELAATLRRLGIETLGEFALLRRAQVAERFGAVGLAARDLAHGREPPLRPRRPVEPLVERIDLIDDAAGQARAEAAATMAAGFEHALALLVERLIARPERAGRTLRGLMLVARFAEGGSWTARVVTREPTADPARVKTVLLPKLLELPRPAAALELRVDAFGPLEHRAETLFGDDPEAERAERLKSAAEQARLAVGGAGMVARIVRMEEGSRLPERRAALSPGPAKSLALPRPITVRADEDGRPLTVAAPRRVPVAHERERWVVEDRWWTGRPVRRRYFELVLADGSNVVVFRDLASGRWFEQRG